MQVLYLVRKGVKEEIDGKESSTTKGRQGVKNVSMIVLVTEWPGWLMRAEDDTANDRQTGAIPAELSMYISFPKKPFGGSQ